MCFHLGNYAGTQIITSLTLGFSFSHGGWFSCILGVERFQCLSEFLWKKKKIVMALFNMARNIRSRLKKIQTLFGKKTRFIWLND